MGSLNKGDWCIAIVSILCSIFAVYGLFKVYKGEAVMMNSFQAVIEARKGIDNE